MKMNGRILLTIAFLSTIAPVVVADVIYYYNGSIKVNTTSMPIVLSVGPNGYVPGYITTSVSVNGFTTTISLTNATYNYFYQFLTIRAYKPGILYTTNISATTGTYVKNAWLVVQRADNGQTVVTFKIINNGVPYRSLNYAVLTPGMTYYVSLLVEPNIPLPVNGTNLGR